MSLSQFFTRVFHRSKYYQALTQRQIMDYGSYSAIKSAYCDSYGMSLSFWQHVTTFFSGKVLQRVLDLYSVFNTGHYISVFLNARVNGEVTPAVHGFSVPTDGLSPFDPSVVIWHLLCYESNRDQSSPLFCYKDMVGQLSPGAKCFLPMLPAQFHHSLSIHSMDPPLFREFGAFYFVDHTYLLTDRNVLEIENLSGSKRD